MSALDQHSFTNALRSLFNIDGYQLPELAWGQQLDFVQNPVKYFIQADDEQQAAIWREVAKRQAPESTYANGPMSAAAPELLEALYQYRNDLQFPVAEDSKLRRIEMIDRLIAKVARS